MQTTFCYIPKQALCVAYTNIQTLIRAYEESLCVADHPRMENGLNTTEIADHGDLQRWRIYTPLVPSSDRAPSF
jgi:hypothetical protein